MPKLTSPVRLEHDRLIDSKHRYVRGENLRHYRYFIKSLWISGLSVPSVGGDLLVVVRPEQADADWELVHSSSEQWPVPLDLYDLDMHGPEAEFVGSAALVRSDGRSHVFRGTAGSLEAFPVASDEDSQLGLLETFPPELLRRSHGDS